MPEHPKDAAPQASTADPTPEILSVPIVAEELAITSEQVAAATVRIDKRVCSRTQHVDVPVTRERVEIERRRVDRAVDHAPPIRQEGETLIIPVLEEVVVVEKRLVVREELHVKRVSERARVQRDISLESEHAIVERIDEPVEPAARTPDLRRTNPLTQGANRMDRTLVGVFETREQANAVRQELLQIGVPESQLHVREHDDDDGTLAGSDTSTRRASDDDRKPGFFERLFGGLDADEDHASQYSEAVRHGHYVVVVDCVPDARIEDATLAMARNGAVDVDERVIGWRGNATGETAGVQGETMSERAGDAIARGAERVAEAVTPDDRESGAARRSAASDTTATGGTGETTRIPVVEEQLEVGKRQVQRGGVRVYTRLMERPVEEQVTLREERAHVERRPVDRAATEAELGAAFQEGSIELTETVEQPVVSKTARVVEEVEVGKEVSERTEVINDTVRRTEVDVEDLPASRQSANPREDVRRNR